MSDGLTDANRDWRMINGVPQKVATMSEQEQPAQVADERGPIGLRSMTLSVEAAEQVQRLLSKPAQPMATLPDAPGVWFQGLTPVVVARENSYSSTLIAIFPSGVTVALDGLTRGGWSPAVSAVALRAVEAERDEALRVRNNAHTYSAEAAARLMEQRDRITELEAEREGVKAALAEREATDRAG